MAEEAITAILPTDWKAVAEDGALQYGDQQLPAYEDQKCTSKSGCVYKHVCLCVYEYVWVCAHVCMAICASKWV